MNLHSTVEEGSFTGGEIYKRPLMHMSLEHGLIFQKKKWNVEGRKVLWRRINSRRRRRGRRVWCGYGIVCMVIYEGSDYAHGKLFHHFELQRRRFQTSALAQSLLKRSCYLFLLFSSGFFCTLLKKIWDEALFDAPPRVSRTLPSWSEENRSGLVYYALSSGDSVGLRIG